MCACVCCRFWGDCPTKLYTRGSYLQPPLLRLRSPVLLLPGQFLLWEYPQLWLEQRLPLQVNMNVNTLLYTCSTHIIVNCVGWYNLCCIYRCGLEYHNQYGGTWSLFSSISFSLGHYYLCLSVCLLSGYGETSGQIFVKLVVMVQHWPRKKPLNFGMGPNHRADTHFIFHFVRGIWPY